MKFPPSFVIHKHRASELHYDLRLEISGVLKSWVLPKGPTLDTAVKRLAFQVDDQALSYMHFEGLIKQGCDAEELIIWDRGSYLPETDMEKGLKEGNLAFSLDGSKLMGGFILIRLDKWSGKYPMWLLKKKLDKFVTDQDITLSHPGSIVSLRRID
ncbi:MAG: hypothetical protein GX817_01955 [Elusimicrobia bacterium]|nr:hypothetical protein [Elusimicrobiota bacterium]